MDTYSAIGATSGIASLLGVIGYGVYKAINHSRCRSACCGRKMLDVYVNLEEPVHPPTPPPPANAPESKAG
jgi:hypothetical protein